MANASSGGLVLYGVEDDGTIEGSDKAFQSFDQSIQNSVHSAIKPSLQIKLYKRNVLGNDVFIVAVPKWNGTNVYQYENRVHIRKGTNVFAVSPEELKQLHDGRAVI